MPIVRVLFVDPHRLMREGIRSLMQGTCFQIVADSANPKDALQKIADGLCVDLVLADLPRTNGDAESLLRGVRRMAPGAKLVFLTDQFESQLLASLCEEGVCGLLKKDISTTALLHSLELVMLGEDVFPIDFRCLPGKSSQAVTAENVVPASNSDTNDLSSREVEILHCLTGGLANKLIARKLAVAETTVKAHIKTILRKINVDNRTQAAVWCLTRDLEVRSEAAIPSVFEPRTAEAWNVYSRNTKEREP
jgi:two-component system nitrate/nitrite response regulator NarL